MVIEGLGAYCLAKIGTEREWPFGPQAAVFKVGSRIFAILAEDEQPARISLKCEPALADQLRDTYPAVGAGYHLDKQHWNTVALDGTVPEDELLGWVDDSYDLVVAGLPQYVQRSLGWTVR